MLTRDREPMRRRRALAGFVGFLPLLVATATAACRAGGAARESSSQSYEVFAVRYATLPDFPVRALVAGADSARRMDIAMMVWLLRGSGGRVVLVDAGFYRDKFLSQWKPVDYVRPSDALARVGLRPGDISDVIISHVHWDHADGADLFPRARVWIQRDEYEYYVGDDGRPRNRGIDSADAELLSRLRASGRLMLVGGDAREIIPGITVYTGGKHTYASQYAAVRTPSGTVVIASDNLYLYENLDRRAPIAQTLDAASNLRAQERMLAIVGDRRLIIPGHDPAVFERFPRPGAGVAAIAPRP